MARRRVVVIVGARSLGRRAFIVKNPNVVVIVVNRKRFARALGTGARVGELPPPPDDCVYLYNEYGIVVGYACPFDHNVTARARAELNRLVRRYLTLARAGSCDCETVNGTTRCTCSY